MARATMSSLAEVKRLSSFDLHESAILLASFCVSQSSSSSSHHSLSSSLARCALGNALKADRQFKRAIHAYEQALHDLPSSSTTISAGLSSALEADLLTVFDDDHNLHTSYDINENNDAMESSAAVKRTRRSSGDLCLVRASIRFRVALCLVALKQDADATAVLELVQPVEDLPGPAVALLAKLKHRALATLSALDSSSSSSSSYTPMALYKLAVSKHPWALEAALKLVVEFEAPALVDAAAVPEEWVAQLLKAHGLAAANRHHDALAAFARLLAANNNRNPHLLTNMAKLQLQLGNREQALDLFSKSHQADVGLSLDAVDIYASILRGLGDSRRLVQLTHELLASGGGMASSSNARPEPWIASALLAEMGDDREKALRYSAKALECDALHLPALHFRGALLLALNRPLESLACCTRAFTLKRDFNGAKGLTDAYLALNRPLDAIAIAQEAVRLAPHDARAYIVLAKALFASSSSSPERLELSLASLARALKLDADNLGAVMLQADVRVAQFKLGLCSPGEVARTATQMKRALHVRPGVHINSRDVLHCKIGNLFLLAGDQLAALEHFTDALAWNAHCAEAQDALDMLELQQHRHNNNNNNRNPRRNQQHASSSSTPTTSLKRSPPPAFRLMMSARDTM